jgi:succinoglycan biosynthesis transport protein ExoP
MVIRYAPTSPERAAVRPRAPQAGALPLGLRVATIIQKCLAGLRRARLWIAVAFLLPLLAAVAWEALRTPVYRTSAAVSFELGGGRQGAPADPAVLAAQMRLAGSRTVLQRAIDREKLVEDESFLARPSGVMAVLKLAMNAVGLGGAAPTEDRAAAILRIVSGSVVATAGDGPNLIEIWASAESPAMAMRLANALAQSFVDELTATADQALGSERSRADRRADELKSRLREAERKLAQYRVQNGLDAAQSRVAGADQELSAQLARARLAASEARARYEQIQKATASGKEPDVVADLIRTPSLERLKTQYSEASAQEISFRSSLGPRHPAYLEVQQLLREKRRLLQEGLRLALTSARIEWQTARELEMSLEKRVGPVDLPAPQSQQAPMQLRELERDVELARSAYERHIRSVDASEPGGSTPAARLVAAAAQPLHPTSQGRRAIWGAALAASFALMALAALSGIMREFAGLPRAPARAAVKPPRKAAEPAKASPASPPVRQAAPTPAPGASPRQKAEPFKTVRVASRPASPPEALSIDHIADELARGVREFQLQTVFVTSYGGAKSDAALALARAARQRQLRVLMIDADEEHAATSLAHGGGAASGWVRINGRVRPLIPVDGSTRGGVWLIPVESRIGDVAPSAAAPLNGIAGHFDLVVIEGPRLAGALMERKLARAAQGVLLAVDGGEAPAVEPVCRALGVSPELLRVVRSPAPATDPAPEPRPRTVVRLRKAA